MQTSALVFACHSAVCAPPPAGTGGSLRAQGAVARVAARLAVKLQNKRDKLFRERAIGPALDHSAGELTHVAGLGQVRVAKLSPGSLMKGDTILHKLRPWKIETVQRGGRTDDRILTLRDRNGNTEQRIASESEIINVIRK